MKENFDGLDGAYWNFNGEKKRKRNTVLRNLENTLKDYEEEDYDEEDYDDEEEEDEEEEEEEEDEIEEIEEFVEDKIASQISPIPINKPKNVIDIEDDDSIEILNSENPINNNNMDDDIFIIPNTNVVESNHNFNISDLPKGFKKENIMNWTKCKLQSWESRHLNANAYYYRFNDPNEPTKNGSFSKEEEILFFQTYNEWRRKGFAVGSSW